MVFLDIGKMGVKFMHRIYDIRKKGKDGIKSNM